MVDGRVAVIFYFKSPIEFSFAHVKFKFDSLGRGDKNFGSVCGDLYFRCQNTEIPFSYALNDDRASRSSCLDLILWLWTLLKTAA